MAVGAGVVALSLFSGPAVAHAAVVTPTFGGIATGLTAFLAPSDAAAATEVAAPEPEAPPAEAAPAQPPEGPDAPATEVPAPPAEAPTDPAAAPTVPEPTVAEPPAAEPPPDGAAPDVAAPARDGEGDAAEVEAAPEDESAEIDPNLLEAEPADPTPMRRPPQPVEDPEAEAAALEAAYDSRYRPADNPTKINFVVRGLFTNMGGKGSVGGRMGGVRADVGPAWNQFVVAGTVSAWGGKVLLPEGSGAEMNALVGIGPTVGLGRLVLLGRGFLDLRAGYDFMYGVVNERADGVVLQTQTDSGVVFTQTDNLLPHGPRVTLDLGLVTDTRGRKYFQGFGASMGWQGMVGSLRGNLPFTNMLTMGLVYWFG